MSARRRWIRWAASRRRSASRSLPVKSSGRAANSGFEQGQEGPERRLLAAVRDRSHQDQVAVRVGGQSFEELVPLVPTGTPDSGVGAGVGLVDDDQLGTGPQEVAP